MTDDDLCPMSNLPPDQCALPCHRNESLPAGVAPEVRRGVEPTGFATRLTVPASEQHESLDTRSRPTRAKRPRTACRYVGEDWLTREHLHGCDDHGCEGCKPCDEDHCALFGCPSHVNADVGIITCPSCIGEFRDTLVEIEQLTALVHAELEHASVGADPEHDVDEVVNLAGPFADPDAVDQMRAALHAEYEARGLCDLPRHWLLVNDVHPVEQLARMERDLRREYEQPAVDTVDQRPEVVMSRAAAYLRRMLDGRFPHDEAFEECFRKLRRLRTRLEAVLSDSRAPETGAPCPTCAVDYADTDRRPGRLIKRHGAHPSGKDDRWVCPDNPDHKWSIVDYRMFVEGAYLAHADRLTASQIKQQYDIPPGTVRYWAAKGRIRSVGKTRRGVLLYRVADVLALRDQTKETADA